MKTSHLLTVGNRRSRCRSFEREERSTVVQLEAAGHHDRNHQRWQIHHTASVGWGIGQETEQVVHRIHLAADQGTDLEIAEWALGQLTEVLAEAFHRIEGNKWMELLGILGWVRSEGCSLEGLLRSQAQLVLCLYPTKTKSVQGKI